MAYKEEKKYLMTKFGIDKKLLSKMRNEYMNQRRPCLPTCSNRKLDANKDPVEWRITFEEWIKIWLDSGHYPERGTKKGQYCQMRKDDIGPYEVGNITIGQVSENHSDANKDRKYPPHTAEQNEANSKRQKGALGNNADHTIYHFIHKKSGITFTGTRIELQEAYPEYNWNKGNLSAMINPNNKKKTCCGWRIEKNE